MFYVTVKTRVLPFLQWALRIDPTVKPLLFRCTMFKMEHQEKPHFQYSECSVSLIWFFGPWILRSSDGSSLIWDITSSPRGVEPPFTRQLELQTAWDKGGSQFYPNTT